MNELKEPNYYEVFLKAAKTVWTEIEIGATSIEGAVDILRGILKAKHEQDKRNGFTFDKYE